MKIHVDNVSMTATTGPNTFARRLCDELFMSGHQVVDSGPEADVSLVFIEPSGQPLAKKVVQRLDGIWTKPSEFEARNAKIKSFYASADAVVFQSEFDKTFITRHWNLPKQYAVIRNGIRVEPVRVFSSPELLELRKLYDQIFVCSANWHRQKRLKENIEAWYYIKSQIPSEKCGLIVLGAHPDHWVADPHVFYARSVPKEVYMQVYSMANWMIHLAWRDHCPNTVVECLSQGTPIICSSDGGTKELIQDFGIVIDESSENDLLPFDYDNPPQINVTNCQLRNISAKIPDVSIENCCKQYVELFERIVQ